jgi:hypothetical protein
MIKGPKNAIPTPKGWVHSKTGELLKAGKISQQQIDEWHGVPEEVVQHEEHVIQTLHEAPHVEVEVDKPTYRYFSTFAQGYASSSEE